MKFINDQADAVRNAWLMMHWRVEIFSGRWRFAPPLLVRLTDDTTHFYARQGTA